MRTLLLLALIVGLSFELIPCDIDLKLESRTEKKFRVDVFVPSLKMKADNIIFNEKDQKKKINVKGEDCDSKKWMIQSLKVDEETHEWKEVGNITAKFFGKGHFGVIFNDDLMPTINGLNGVWSSEGNIWG